MSSNKKGPWQLASAGGGMPSMARVIANFPATGLTTEEIGLRFAHASGGVALCRAGRSRDPPPYRSRDRRALARGGGGCQWQKHAGAGGRRRAAGARAGSQFESI